MTHILIATNNPGKRQEFNAILGATALPFVTPAEVGLELEVDETGQTYAANAELKARAFAQASGLIVLADDSGLEVDALSGAPGVYSARYAGPNATSADRRTKLLRELSSVPAPRLARFRCVIAVAHPSGELHQFEGVCEGEIIFEERGTNGFGYDPLFYLPGYGQTMAELPPAVKNQISHRAKATLAALPYLQQILG